MESGQKLGEEVVQEREAASGDVEFAVWAMLAPEVVEWGDSGA